MTTVLERPAGAAVIGPEEVRRRVAVLKRFRELLTQQRGRFARYLEVLDTQKNVIEAGSADELVAHVELEEHIVADIFAIQKVIEPLEDMYQTLLPPENAPEGLAGEERELSGLKAALQELRAEAVVRSDRNKRLLGQRMEELRLELKNVKTNPYNTRRAVYAETAPSLVDLNA